MAEVQSDPAIKLFGKTIQLLPDKPLDEQRWCHPSTSLHKPSQNGYIEAQGEDTSSHQRVERSIDPSTSSGLNEDPKTPNTDNEISSTNTNKTNDPSDMTNSEGKSELKKPDKLLPCPLPCPRCNSMDTKFCYFNNYKANQPRHFCKNCQRYWTAGGTMRNVPVGSGQRKNKSSSASHYRHIIVSEALPAARSDGVLHQSVLTFGSDAPLCESMASVLNLDEKSQQEKRNKDDFSVFWSTNASNLKDKGQDGNLNNFQGYPLQVPHFPAPPWPFPWNSAQYRSPMTPSTPTAFGPSGFHAPFYPPPQYWGCTVPPGPWSMPAWLTPQNPFPQQYLVPSSPSSPLGKHSRDGNLLTSSNSSKEHGSETKDQETAVLIPKTLRINDPNEASKSSIWSTLGIKNDSNNSIKGGSILKAFEPKGSQKNQFEEKSTVLHANPAALSRSVNFHENSGRSTVKS